MLYISHTGCQWRFLPVEFGPWTRVWSQFRRWSKNGTWSRVLTALHASSRTALGRKDPRPSMVVIDTHLARGASNGGVTFHNQGGPYGRPTAPNGSSASTSRPATLRASRPASTSEASAVEQILDDLARSGADERLELVLVDRALRSRGPATLEQIQLRSSPSGWTSPHATSTGQSLSSHPSRLARRGGPRPSRASATSGALLRRHRDFGTGWLHVASIAEVLRATC